MQAQLSHQTVRVLADAYELSRHDVIDDARVARIWSHSEDDLLAWLCRQHEWRPDQAEGYLNHLHSLRLSRPFDRHA